MQGSSYLLGQRFRACLVFKIALKRGEGEKRDQMQISKQSTLNLSPNTLSPVHYICLPCIWDLFYFRCTCVAKKCPKAGKLARQFLDTCHTCHTFANSTTVVKPQLAFTTGWHFYMHLWIACCQIAAPVDQIGVLRQKSAPRPFRCPAACSVSETLNGPWKLGEKAAGSAAGGSSR